MVLFNQVRVWVSLGSIFFKNPFLAFIGTFFMSFFEINKQNRVYFFNKETLSKRRPFFRVVFLRTEFFLEKRVNRICGSLIDVLTPLSPLIVSAISQQFDWMRNGQGNKLDY